MIVRLVGEVDEIGVREVVLLTGGVGYGVSMLNREANLLKVGQSVRLYVHSHEDSRNGETHLYGFLDRDELSAMETLLLLPGVGPGNALKALERMNAEALLQALIRGDASVLRGAGLPSKSLISLPRLPMTPDKSAPEEAIATGAVESAIQALRNLGFKDDTELREIVQKVAQGETEPITSSLVRLALAELRGRHL